MALGNGMSMEQAGGAFVDAFNRRDADALVALCDPQIDYHPTLLVGRRSTFNGHEGMRRWLAEIGDASAIDPQVRLREVRVIDERRFAIEGEVVVDGAVLSPLTMFARLGEGGLIVEAHSYLSDGLPSGP